MIPIDRAHLYVSAGTHPGRKGKNNEDRYGVSAYQVSQEDLTPVLLAVIADGVGGHRAGEVAAEMAVEIVSHVVAESDGRDAEDILADAIYQANKAITTRAESSTDFQGMGTTCTCVWIIGDRLFTTSVGDSRVYFVRNDSIQQITIDHTWVQKAIETGALTPEQARNHPNAHVIRRHLGSHHNVVLDFRLRLEPTESDSESESNQGTHLQAVDQLLLCSDGLTDLVNEDEILEILLKTNGDQAVDDLLALANERGGHDNITAVLLRVPARGIEYPDNGKKKRRMLMRGLVAAAIVLAVGAIIVGSLFRVDNNFDLTTVLTQSLIVESSLDSNGLQVLPATTQTLEGAGIASATPLTPTLAVTTRPAATYTPWPTSTQAPTE